MITEKEVRFPSSITLSKECMDIITKLLNKNPEERLGYKSIKEIKNHAFFRDVSFEDIL